MPFQLSRDDLNFLIVTLISLANVAWTIWSSKKKIQPEVEKLESEVADLITQGAKVSIEIVLQRLHESRKSERDWRNYAVSLQVRFLELGHTPPPFIPSDTDPKIPPIRG